MNLAADLLVIVKSDRFGVEEPDLGARLVQNFLTALVEAGEAPALMIFMGPGIFLTTEGSPVLGLLEPLVAAGTEIRSCGTCLDYYGRRDRLRVGQAGNMPGTVAAMKRFARVLHA